MKTCSVCKESLPLTEFSKNAGRKDGLNTKCKKCYGEYQSAYYRANKDKHMQNPCYQPAYRRAKRYGLTQEELNAIIVRSGGKCEVCLTRVAAVVDHDHITGAVRGYLCHGCNTGLGKLGDSIESLKKAIEYLERQ